jgi:hypothetical protein
MTPLCQCRLRIGGLPGRTEICGNGFRETAWDLRIVLEAGQMRCLKENTRPASTACQNYGCYHSGKRGNNWQRGYFKADKFCRVRAA